MDVQQVDLTTQAFKRNPFPTFAQLRETGPLVRTKLPLVGEVWLATTYNSVCQVLRDQSNFVLEPQNAGKKHIAGMQWWMPRMFRILAKNMLTSDEPNHRRLRGLVEQAFLRQSVEAMRDRISSLADRYLDQMEQKAEENNGTVDLNRFFARPFPLVVICELLGLPEEDQPRFSRWAGRLTKAGSLFGILAALPGIWRLLRYFRRQFRECRQAPRPGLISALVEAEDQGDRLSEDELLAMAFLLLLAGHETTVYLISGGILALSEHDGQRAELISDWSRVESAVEETLRYVSPVQMTKPRIASRDVELHGQTIKRGENVIALLASANCDPEQFEEPERFEITRHPNHHVAFGTGIHVCLGLKLARAEAAIAFEKLFTRFPRLKLAVAPSDLQWLPRFGLRAVASLPVQLGAR